MTNRIKAYFSLLLTSIIWGIASPVIKYTLSYIEPFAFLFWRFLITGLVFLPILIIYLKKKKIKLTFAKIRQLSALGFLGTTLSLGLLFLGYKYTTAVDGALIYSTAPIIVIIGGALFLTETITKQERWGAFIAFLGSIVTVSQPILEGQALALTNLAGNLLVFCSAVVWAVYCLWLRKTETEEKTDPLVLTALGFFSGLITIIPFFLWENSITHQQLIINHSALPGIFYMSLFSSIIAYFSYNLGYSLIEASEAVLFDYLKPLFAVPLAAIWLKEPITLSFLAGAALIALGVFLTEYKPQKNS